MTHTVLAQHMQQVKYVILRRITYFDQIGNMTIDKGLGWMEPILSCGKNQINPLKTT